MKRIYLPLFLFIALYPKVTVADFNSWQDSDFTLQNTAPVTVTVDIGLYSLDGSGIITHTIEIAPNESYQAAPHAMGTPENWAGSAVITATHPLAGIVHQVNFSSAGNPEGEGTTALPGSDETALKLFAPWTENSADFSTDIAIQNVGSSKTDVTITYYDHANGSSSSEYKANLAPYGSWLATPPTGFSGGTVIQSRDEPLAAVVNVKDSIGKTLSTYKALPATTSSSSNYLPFIHGGNDRWSSMVHPQNVITVTLTDNQLQYHEDGATGWNTVNFGPLAPGEGYALPITNIYEGYGWVETFNYLGRFNTVINSWNDQTQSAYCYNAPDFPLAQRDNWYIPFVDYYSEIAIKNSGPVTTTLDFVYTTFGITQTMVITSTAILGPYEKKAFIPPVTEGVKASAVITAQEAAIAINVNNKKVTGDYGVYSPPFTYTKLFIPSLYDKYIAQKNKPWPWIFMVPVNAAAKNKN